MAVAVVASSCQKDLGGSPDSPVVPGAVPADFDWKTTRNVTVSVSAPVVEGATPPYAVIRIYSSPILSAENLAARGVAKSAMPFRSAFTLPAGTENLYVQTTLPDGTKSVKMVGAHGTVAVTGASMKAAAAPKMRLAANARIGSSMPDYPKMEAPDAASFDSKAVITAIESGKSYQLGASWAFYAAPEYLIPAGAEVAGKLDLNGGFSPYQAPILYVAGKLTLSSLNIGRAKLAVLPGGEVKIGTLKIQPSAADGAAVYVFADGKRFISGNRCDKPVTGKANNEDLDLYAYKLKLLDGYRKAAAPANSRGKIGIPLCLNMYELLPFWHTLFSRLGFEVVVSPFSNRKLYQSGQATIPSDTACFPAKLSHGHIHWLCEQGVDAIFYPCMSYNLDEHLGDNHYNCPVVAYYPEVLEGNCPELKATKFIYDYFNLERRKDFYKKFQQALDHYFPGLDRKAVHEAIDAAYDEYARHMQQLRDKGTEIIAQARREGRRIIVLAGRPYHVDPEVNHGIDQLIIRQGAAVISEDSVSWHEQKFQTSVLNQWTYHSRLYAAAKYCTENPDMDLVQLVSFGCGLDAVTTDETREILQAGSKLYTQLKIDEITNLGAVNIRLRSLFAALEERKEDHK